VAADDLKDHVDEIFQGVRDKLGYKRSDLTPSESGIITPHFEYRVSVGLEPDDPGSSLWTYDVRRITSREVVESDAFDDVFGRYLDSFEQEFATSLDVEQFIDLVEGRDPPGIHLEYDRKCIEVRGEPGRSRWEAGGNVGGSQNHGPAGPVPARPHRGFVFCAPVSHGSTPHARIARRHDALEAAEETTHLARRT
jgi:hypothetical protein